MAEKSAVVRALMWLNDKISSNKSGESLRELDDSKKGRGNGAMGRGLKRMSGDQGDGYKHGRRHDTPTKALRQRRPQGSTAFDVARRAYGGRQDATRARIDGVGEDALR